MTDERRVLIFCAHSDDQAFGAGGFMSKVASEGGKILTIICSFGELSLPHLKPAEVVPIRIAESQKADKILGGSGVIFLGLKEGKFYEDAKEKNLFVNLEKIINEFKPDTIMTHAVDDPHPDHRAVLKIALELHSKSKTKFEVFSFEIWNPANLKKRRTPMLMVDITKTFHKKIKAIEAFRSQINSLVLLLWSVYAKALYWGLRNRTRYAEVFYKVK